MTEHSADIRYALVTGGASGIGEACARRLAAQGFSVIIADMNAARAEEVANSISGHAVVVDISDEVQFKQAIRAVEERHGPLEVAVLCAGIAHAAIPADEFPMDQWDAVMRVNLRGSFISAAAVGDVMSRRGNGSIVLIASISGIRSTPLHSYEPSKAAIISLTANLATEWARSGVRVNCISPGFVLTPLSQGMFDRGERDRSIVEAESGQGRLISPEEVANAAVFLSSDEASGITGVNLPVDAGWLASSSWRTWGGVPDAR